MCNVLIHNLNQRGYVFCSELSVDMVAQNVLNEFW